MKVIVKKSHSVDYKKRLYLPGERIDLPDKEAKRLIAKDVVKSLKVGNGVIAKTPEALQ